MTVEEIEGGHRISITDENGVKTFDVLNGESATPVKCIVGIEPVDMTPDFFVTYSDGTTDQITPSGVLLHDHVAVHITGGTFDGAVYAKSGSQPPEKYLLRNIKVGLTAEDPENEGEMFFKCK